MKNLTILLILFCFAFSVTTLLAKVELHKFENNDQHLLYKKLSEQLRCLVCQNQNLADSNAELAQDMRLKTYQLVVENKSENEIIDYWVTRYGDFVLYNPPFKSSTFILWVGPFALLILALFFGKKIIQRSTTSSDSNKNKDKDAHENIRKLLTEDKK